MAVTTEAPRVFTAGTTQANESLKIALAECLEFMGRLELPDDLDAAQARRIYKRGSALLAELRGEGPRYV